MRWTQQALTANCHLRTTLHWACMALRDESLHSGCLGRVEIAGSAPLQGLTLEVPADSASSCGPRVFPWSGNRKVFVSTTDMKPTPLPRTHTSCQLCECSPSQPVIQNRKGKPAIHYHTQEIPLPPNQRLAVFMRADRGHSKHSENSKPIPLSFPA